MAVQRLDDLHLSAPPGKRLTVLGDPIAHSLSPAMHNAALQRMALDAPELKDWAYEAIHVPAVDLPKALEILHREQVRGINLTIPHKVDVLGMIDEMDETARAMGAVNTLIWTGSGYVGTNTDGFGIRKAILEAFNTGMDGKDIWLFGAGGAARGIVVSCLEGACRRLTVVNRSAPRLAELEEQFRRVRPDGLERVRFHLQESVPVDPDEDCLIINATSLGLKATDPNPVDSRFLEAADALVYDTTYGQENALFRTCQQRGIPYADGLSMLVWQGVRSLEIWTGRDVPASEMRQAAESTLRERRQNG